jgi:hypothetical protein
MQSAWASRRIERVGGHNAIAVGAHSQVGDREQSTCCEPVEAALKCVGDPQVRLWRTHAALYRAFPECTARGG